jgi:hypothetical protein
VRLPELKIDAVNGRTSTAFQTQKCYTEWLRIKLVGGGFKSQQAPSKGFSVNIFYRRAIFCKYFTGDIFGQAFLKGNAFGWKALLT